MIEYDIVIIGGSLAGRYAAFIAKQLRAKVVLVEPEASSEFLYLNALSQLAFLKSNIESNAQFGLFTSHPTIPKSDPKSDSKFDLFTAPTQTSVDWETAMLWAFGIESHVSSQYSREQLCAQGVDVIVGSGQFQSDAHLAFSVNSRLLVGRTYLLATGSKPAAPNIEGLDKVGFLTLENIWQSISTTKIPRTWVILGGTPQSIELAQALARLDCSVTLIVERSNIIAHVDPEVVQLLEAQLEADGVCILKQSRVTQVLRIDDKKWLQAGDKAIETDEIVIAAEYVPNIESLNLAAVGVKWHQNRLLVNTKLQTTNKRIYACGEIIGGYALSNVANYEANIALRNALFFSGAKVDYQYVPWGLRTQPFLAHVGLTEAQAQRLYDFNEIIVLRQYFKSLPAAQINDQTTGLVKLVTLKNGEILGASVLGLDAGELVNLLSFAINNKIKISRLFNSAFVYPTVGEILLQAARDWDKIKLNRNMAKQEFLEDFFQFCRDWKL